MSRFGDMLLWLRGEETSSERAEMEQLDRIDACVEHAQECAYSADSDDEAVRKLRALISDCEPDVVSAALSQCQADRVDYVADRAYRLLSAAVSGSPVEPIDPEKESLFLEEEALGRLPLQEAFAKLAGLEPYLAELGERVRPEGSSKVMDQLEVAARVETFFRLPNKKEPILRSRVAAGVACQYVEVVIGRIDRDAMDVPYFSDPQCRL